MNAEVHAEENALKRRAEGRSSSLLQEPGIGDNIPKTNIKMESDNGLLHSLFLRSLPLALTNAAENANSPIRMSVMGPMQSGKTSLLMDLAYSIIKSSTSSSHNDKNGADCESFNISKVLFIVPAYKRQLLNFPLHCRPLLPAQNDGDQATTLAGHADTDASAHGRRDGFDQRQKDSEKFRQSLESLNEQKRRDANPGSSQQRAGGNWTEGDEWILDHIDIQYVKNVTDLILFLSTVQSKNKHDISAIIVDDLDHFIRDESHACQSGNDLSGQHLPANTIEIMKVIQLLALIADAVSHMEESLRASESKQQRRIHVITSINIGRLPLGTSPSQSKTIHSLMHNYTPTIASIEKINQESFQQDGEQFNLNRFFGKEMICRNHKAISMECQSAWKIRLQTIHVNNLGAAPVAGNRHENKDATSCISQAKFCIGRDVSSRNSLQYDEDKEEHELFWASNA